MGIVEGTLGVIALIIILFLFFWPISIPLTIIYLIKRNKNKKLFKSMVVSNNKNYKEIDSSRLEGLDITDLSKLKIYLYDIYYKFELAYNHLDYNSMYNLCTERLYNLYHSSITLNLKFDEKKIIDQIKLEKMIIYDTYTSQSKQVVYTVIEVSNISYSIKSNGKIVSGSPTKPIKESFEVVFVKYFKQKDKLKCPNCGASVEGSICDYCKSKIDNTGDYRIDSIKKIV